MPALSAFHPAVAAWFRRELGEPTAPQRDGWPSIQAGRHTLIAAPTGSGKTLAAFLGAIDELVRLGVAGALCDQVYVVYVSPLKALSNDIDKNLARPIAGIARELAALGLPPVTLRTEVRTGDTPAAKRTAMLKRPPHIFVTTPESLYILLTTESGRRMLQSARTLIVDEIHALVASKRGSHFALSAERLAALVHGNGGRSLVRVGLSATQKPIEEVARFLVGTESVAPDGTPDCAIADAGHARALDLAIELPGSPLETVMSGEVWEELYDRLAELVRAHRTTLVFVNTRRLAERLTRHLSERIGEDRVTSHHGSLSREHRLTAERRLKSGELSALVATASLELGIDIGEVDLVCQIGGTRTIAALLQRVGRSGHAPSSSPDGGGVPRGRLFPLSRDELCEAVALLDCVRRRELDRIAIPQAPLDIAAQQIVATVALEAWSEEELWQLLRRAWPYRALSRHDFDEVVRMLADGFATARGRRGALVHHDAVNGRVRGRKSARLAAITSGGAIPDLADYEVVLDPEGVRVGTVNEDFAIESMAGDIFQLGNVSYRIRRVEQGKVRVEDARGQPPTIPFWLGEAPSRSEELSFAVSRLRSDVAAQLEDAGIDATVGSLVALGIAEPAARQVVDYLAVVLGSLGAMPTQERLVLERFFDETGGMHLVVHSPFGSRVNRAWGLALRKCFCRRFNFELQAAATEDAIVLSLGPTHSFPLDEVWGYLRATGVRDLLIQALLDAPMFTTRWRWNATRALSVLRFRGGKKVPAPFLRMDADDLLTVCFPDQVACLENVVGDRQIPEHPLVQQTIRDCLEEAMDIDGLERLLGRMENGEVALLARELTEPSPLASDILNARPYAFLDDAPLEERRTQAVMSRRWLDPTTASDLGALDQAAIDRVRDEARPDPRDADELHDALVLHGFVTREEGAGSEPLFGELSASRRACVLSAGGATLWVAAERLPLLRAVHPDASLLPSIEPPARFAAEQWERATAIREIVRGRLEAVGPISAEALARSFGVALADVEIALAALEGEGFVLRGRFTADGARGPGAPRSPGGATLEWCERRLLARIHRYTIGRLRQEIEPVSAADFLRFLLRWQHLDGDTRMEGPQGLAEVIAQLDGFELQAAAWESDVLPARTRDYDPAWLDAACLSGRVAWARRTAGTGRGGPVRTSPVALMQRAAIPAWLGLCRSKPGTLAPIEELSSSALAVHEQLAQRGASFFDDLLRASGLVRAQLEDALGELVSAGLVASDGFSGLRALIAPADRRRATTSFGRRRRAAVFTMEAAGRWSLCLPSAGHPNPPRVAAETDEQALETIAWALLRRWGVVFRRVIDREGELPPWRDLLRVYRRLEARGEIRGGRFVAGFSGEQYAVIDAVGALRAVRRREPQSALVAVSAADPLNVVGLLTPGKRVPAIAQNRILFRDGVPIAAREGGVVRFLEPIEEQARWQLEGALVKRAVPIEVRAYLGNAV